MRTWSITLLGETARKCNWDDSQKLSAVCSHLTDILPGTDYDRIFEAAEAWVKASGLPFNIVVSSLCFTIDETEAWPDYKGNKFADHIKGLAEISCASAPTNEKKEPEKAKTRKGRGRKKVEAPAASEKGTQKFPAGTAKAPEEPIAKSAAIEHTDEPKPMPAVPGTTMLVGFLDEPWCRGTKEWLSLDAPIEGQKLGSLLARLQFDLGDGMLLYLDAQNGRPKPGVDVYIKKDGKSIANIPAPIRKYVDHYEITHNGTTYKILSPPPDGLPK